MANIAPPNQKAIPVWHDVTAEILQNDILPLCKPAVLKGYISDWPAVEVMSEREPACQYLNSCDTEQHGVETFVGDHSIDGLFFFNENMDGFNFNRVNETFGTAIERIKSSWYDEMPDSVYVGSVPLQQSMPKFLADNHLNFVPRNSTPRIWLSNQVTVQPHYDQSSNIACVVAGHRRFTLFPPDQIANMYVSPLDNTIAGPQLSMVPFSQTQENESKYPRFQKALEASVVAELEPGDAIYIPSLWWHAVESLADFNVLVNYWWNTQYGPDAPFATLVHGLLTMRNLPAGEKKAWAELFNYFLFQSEIDPMGHLPEDKKGVLGELNPDSYRYIREHFERMMNPEKP